MRDSFSISQSALRTGTAAIQAQQNQERGVVVYRQRCQRDADCKYTCTASDALYEAGLRLQMKRAKRETFACLKSVERPNCKFRRRYLHRAAFISAPKASLGFDGLDGGDFLRFLSGRLFDFEATQNLSKHAQFEGRVHTFARQTRIQL